MNDQPVLRIISGVGAKGPACFLLETAGKRLMLDLGYGPQPGLWPNVEQVGRVDALVLSHSHKDHIGGLALLAKIGHPPIFATAITAGKLPAGLDVRSLPMRGRGDVLGIPVDTGRSGHAPGGVWLRFHGGAGLLYTGDYSTESPLYAFDMPPKSRTVLFDCSYGDDDTPLAERQARLAPHVAGDVLLPAPADGRGPDIALHLAREGRTIRLDEAMRSAIRELTGAARDCLRDGLTQELARLADAALPPGDASGATLSTPADGSSGTTARLIELWENAPQPAMVFTGYIPPGTPADRLVKSGRGKFLRWNVHPRLTDNTALLRTTGAATAIPAFCDRKILPALQAALAPANVTMDTTVPLA
ncbi:MAG: MBL fold metallo-hydrolase [Hyphomicrobiales bacterium]|nr:MBL fold metallo-hydrolase [Hyphomicrobiales bacterium]